MIGRYESRKRELTLGLRLIVPGKPGGANGSFRGRIKVRMVATFEPWNGIGIPASVGRAVHHGVSASG